MSELLTTVDIGKMAGITHTAVGQAANLGEITPAAITPGGRRLFTRAAAEQYIRDRALRMRPISNLNGGGRA